MKIQKTLLLLSFIVAVVGLVWYLSFKSLPEETSPTPSVPNTEIGESNISDKTPSRVPPAPQERQESVRQQFADLRKTVDGEGYWTAQYFEDSLGPIPHSLGLEALLVRTPEELESFLDENSWSIDRCFAELGQSGYVLRLKAKLLPGYQGNLYQDLRNIMLSWEAGMLGDLTPVLFPQEIEKGGQPEVIGTFVPFNSLDQQSIRWVQISLPASGKPGELAYTIVDDFILIGNNASCVSTIERDLIGPG